MGAFNILKKFFRALLITTLFIAVFGVSTFAVDQDDLELEAIIGYDNTMKIGDGNPFEIMITNNGTDFSGEIQVFIKGQDQNFTIYAKEFDMASNSTKNITMTVPLMTIQREIDIKIVSGKKSLYENTVKIDAIYPPESTMIAVVADDADQYRFLSNLMYLQSFNTQFIDYYPSYRSSSMPTEEYQVNSVEPKAMFIEDPSTVFTAERLAFFNYVYIGEVDALSFTEDALNALDDWIKNGGVVVSESGNLYPKTNAVLPDLLKIVQFEKTNPVDLDYLYESIPVDSTFNMAKALIIPEDVKELIVFDEYMGYYKTYGLGHIVQLGMDFATSPLSTWGGKTFLFSDAMSDIGVNTTNETYYYYEDGYMYTNYLSNIPVTKKAPYIIMIVVLALYVIGTGPVLYFILKKKDKRTYLWWLIPAASIGCVLLFFFLGFSTRYNQPIVNNLSVISLKSGDQIAKVATTMNVLNNKKGDLEITWSNKENINIETTNYYYDYYGPQQQSKVIAKINQGNTIRYTLYDTDVWAGNMMKASQVMPVDAGNLVQVTYDADNFVVEVTNHLPITLEYAFVYWGNYYLDLGDIEPGETVVKSEPLDSVYFDSYYSFDESRFGYMNYNGMQTYHEELADDYNLREILNQRYGNNYNKVPGATMDYSVKFVAINHEAVDYNISVNGGDFDVFNTNIFEIESEVHYQKDSEIKFDNKALYPEVTFAYDEDFMSRGQINFNLYDQVFNIYERGIIQLTYVMPTNITFKSMSVAFEKMMTYEQFYGMGKGSANSVKDPVMTLKIYNFDTKAYEIFEEAFSTTKASYFGPDNQVIFRIDTRALEYNTGENWMEYILKEPNIEIKGVVN